MPIVLSKRDFLDAALDDTGEGANPPSVIALANPSKNMVPL